MRPHRYKIIRLLEDCRKSICSEDLDEHLEELYSELKITAVKIAVELDSRKKQIFESTKEL